MWLSYSFKNLYRKRSYSLFFIANFSISMTAIFLLALFQLNVSDYLRENSKQILTADISVSARRDLNEKERAYLEEQAKDSVAEAKLVSTYSMLYAKEQSRLVLIKAISDSYPLYGKLILGSKKEISTGSEKEILKSRSVWMYPEILLQMNLKPGDEIQIGKQSFTIADELSQDVGLGGFGSALAPALYMSLESLQETGLMQFGSTAWYSYFYKWKIDDNIEELASQWSQDLEDPAIRVSQFKNANEQIGRLSGYLNDYLGLVGLVCILLSLVGSYFLFRNFLIEQAKNIALLEINGAGSQRIKKIFLTQIISMSVLSILVSIFLSDLMLPYFAGLTEGRMEISYTIPWAQLLPIAFGIVLFISFSMYPFLQVFLRSNKTESLMGSRGFVWTWKKSDHALFLLPIMIYFLLSIYVSRSLIVGSLFFALVLCAIVIFYFSLRYIIFLLNNKWKPKSFGRLIMLRYLASDPVGTSTIVTALGFSFLLMLLVPQIQSSLNKELRFPKSSLIPDLFLFDIQDEQVELLKSELKEQNLQLEYLSPMIMARLMKVNDQNFEKGDASRESFTREQEQEERFRNRGFNLSYREKLSDSETLVSGKFNESIYEGEGLAEISIEERFAERLSLNMGDKLSFDVQGVEVEGIITSFRKVKWTSFQPNFFILFQSGVLNEAPKTFLGALSNLNKEQKTQIQLSLVKRIPNISIVDVEYLVERILEIFDKMASAIFMLALFSFVTGLFLVFVIANYRARSRRKDFLYLKLFGARYSFLKNSFRNEFLALVFLAFVLAYFVSHLFSWILVYFLFDSQLEYNYQWLLLLGAGAIFLSYIISQMASYRILKSEEFKALLEE